MDVGMQEASEDPDKHVERNKCECRSLCYGLGAASHRQHQNPRLKNECIGVGTVEYFKRE